MWCFFFCLVLFVQNPFEKYVQLKLEKILPGKVKLKKNVFKHHLVYFSMCIHVFVINEVYRNYMNNQEVVGPTISKTYESKCLHLPHCTGTTIHLKSPPKDLLRGRRLKSWNSCTKGRRRSKDHTYSLGMSRNKTTFPVMSDCFDKIRWLDTIHPRELRATRWYLLPVKHQMKPTEIATIIYCTKIQKKSSKLKNHPNVLPKPSPIERGFPFLPPPPPPEKKTKRQGKNRFSRGKSQHFAQYHRGSNL